MGDMIDKNKDQNAVVTSRQITFDIEERQGTRSREESSPNLAVDLEMELAHAGYNGLAALRINVHPEGRVLQAEQEQNKQDIRKFISYRPLFLL